MLSVCLGCRAYERRTARPVSITVEIDLRDVPEGISTDNLKDTICYSLLAKHIKKSVVGKSFNLVEKLAKDTHENVHNFLVKEKRPALSIKITIHKLMSKTSPIKGGVFFTYIGRGE